MKQKVESPSWETQDSILRELYNALGLICGETSISSTASGANPRTIIFKGQVTSTEHSTIALSISVQHFWKGSPKCVVALGDIALERLTGYTGIMDCRGYPIWSTEFGVWVVPTLHPSFVMRGNHK